MKTVYLDTNIFVRFLIKDIPHQFETAKLWFTKIENKEIKAFASILVINELIWILENYYQLKRAIFIPQIEKLLLLNNIKVVEVKKNLVFDILQIMKEKTIDFTDVYLSSITNIENIVSFDKDFAKIKLVND